MKNSGERSRPVGSLKPNDFGLFDMYGNVWTWCHDGYRDYKVEPSGKAAEDSEDNSVVKDTEDNSAAKGSGVNPLGGVTPISRVLRGGSFDGLASVVRSADRNWYPPVLRVNVAGFRPARTYN
jgi:formylglycine-generating enzyme required for sulfatase activity